MKNTSLVVVLMGLALAACSNDQAPATDAAQPEAEAPAAVADSAAPAAAPVPDVTPSTDRPSVIPASLGMADGCSLDAVNGQAIVDTATVNEKGSVQLGGWAADLAAGTSPEQVFVEMAGPTTIFIQASRGTKRPDVAAQYGKPGLEGAGWDVTANLAGVTPGTYKVSIIQVEGDGGISCDSKRSIVIN